MLSHGHIVRTAAGTRRDGHDDDPGYAGSGNAGYQFLYEGKRSTKLEISGSDIVASCEDRTASG